VRILVTNDDGISAAGLHVLAAAIVDAGHDVLVVAPLADCSGQGAAIGPLHLTGKIEFERVDIDDVDADAIAVDGPPALCVMAACLGGFGAPPEVVVSGINAGANTGRAVLHSGTVGAALTGLNFGLPGVAVSQALGEPPRQLAAAAAVAGRVLETVTSVTEPARPAVFNVNVPNLALDAMAGLAPAVLDPGGTVQMALVEREAGVLELDIPRGSRSSSSSVEGTDMQLLEAGYATVTALTGPRALNHRYAADLRQLSLSVLREAPRSRSGGRRRRRKSA
jgi:5'-nucleotidase